MIPLYLNAIGTGGVNTHGDVVAFGRALNPVAHVVNDSLCGAHGTAELASGNDSSSTRLHSFNEVALKPFGVVGCGNGIDNGTVVTSDKSKGGVGVLRQRVVSPDNNSLDLICAQSALDGNLQSTRVCINNRIGKYRSPEASAYLGTCTVLVQTSHAAERDWSVKIKQKHKKAQ